jgi:hypothetical protein
MHTRGPVLSETQSTDPLPGQVGSGRPYKANTGATSRPGIGCSTKNMQALSTCGARLCIV